jgi:hypothetical protein
MAAGDEQLLSLYLTKMNEKGEHDFIWNTKRDEVPSGIFLDQTFWAGMRTNPQYIAKKRADRLSYSWDLLIEHFIKNTASDADRVYIEPAVRLMASEPRLRRRQLAPALIHIMKNTPKGKRAARVVYSNDLPDRAYVFLVVPKLDSQSYEQYREDRRNLLFAYCKVTKLRCPDANLILGIATEPRDGHGGSEDLVFLDVKDWTEERDKEAHWLRDELSLLKENVQRTESSTLEYPDVPQSEDTKATS